MKNPGIRNISLRGLAVSATTAAFLLSPGAAAQETTAERLQDAAVKKLFEAFNSDEIQRKLPISLDLKVFQSGGPDDDLSIGFAYSYKKKFFRKSVRELDDNQGSGTSLEYTLNLSADGNVAFDPEKNPNDFLDTKASFSLDWLRQTVVKTDLAICGAAEELVLGGASGAEIQAAAERCRKTGSLSILRFNLAAEGGFEADQRFTATQYKIGGRAWFSAPALAPNHPLRWANPLALPVGALRYLTGFNDCTSFKDCATAPQGDAFPTITVGLAEIMPDEAGPRVDAGDDSDFLRMDFEISYWAPVTSFDGKFIDLTVAYRYYKELGASDLVKTAGLDDFSLLVVTLGQRNGVFISYRDGQLPFDQRDDEVFELGYKFHF